MLLLDCAKNTTRNKKMTNKKQEQERKPRICAGTIENLVNPAKVECLGFVMVNPVRTSLISGYFLVHGCGDEPITIDDKNRNLRIPDLAYLTEELTKRKLYISHAVHDSSENAHELRLKGDLYREK
jgi:hypothetical protein